MKSTERNRKIDIIRGIAVLTVIIGHSFQRGYGDGYDTLLCVRLIRLYQMPLFILLSGYTLQLSDQRHEQEALAGRLRNKFFGLIYPTVVWNYLIWAVRNFSFVGIKPFISFPDNFLEYTKLLLKYPDYVIWFLWCVFFCTLIIWLGRRISSIYWIAVVFFLHILL